MTGRSASESVEKLVADFQPLAQRLARRYSGRGIVDADLLQVANLGLVLAAQRYDPDLGPFQAYALSTVSGEIKRYLRDHGWLVHVPRTLQEHTLEVDRAVVLLEQRTGRSPNVTELAMETGLDEESVLAALRAREVRFSNPMPELEPAAKIVDLEERAIVQEAIARLPESEAELICMIHVEELTQREAAARLGVSQAAIHRRMRTATRRLREILAEMGYRDGSDVGA